jgi:group I intron endonuclease
VKDTTNNECKVIGNTPSKNEPIISRDITQKKIGIYGLKNKITNKWYVGQTCNEIKNRFSDYKGLRCKGQPKIYRAILKYGYENFEEIILELCKLDRNILNERETFWIKEKNSLKNGYNCNAGGIFDHKPMLGKKHAEETKQKIRIARAKQKIGSDHVSIEARARMSAGRINKSLTSEHCNKLSKSHIGIKQSEESKIKISKSLIGRPKGKWTDERKLRKSLSMIGIKRGPRKLKTLK